MAVVIRPKTGNVEKPTFTPQTNGEPHFLIANCLYFLSMQILNYEFSYSEGELRLEIDDERHQRKGSFKRSLRMLKTSPGNQIVSRRGNSRSRRWSGESHPEILNISDNPLLAVPQEEEVVGIITLEDVIEELLKVRAFIFFTMLKTSLLLSQEINSFNNDDILLQEDIYDEMDHRGSSRTSYLGSSKIILRNQDTRFGSNELSDRINSFKSIS